jgi:carotenoid 1,2-hydratase
LNVGLYGGGKTRWAMTERTAKAIDRGEDHFHLRPQQRQLRRRQADLRHPQRPPPPFPIRCAARSSSSPRFEQGEQFTLDPQWPPRLAAGLAQGAGGAPSSTSPELDWSGDGYVDMNAGLEPLEAGFKSWSWARTAMPDGAAILYDCQPAGGGEHGFALRIHEDGTTEHFEAPPEIALPNVMWGVARPSRSEGDGPRGQDAGRHALLHPLHD